MDKIVPKDIGEERKLSEKIYEKRRCYYDRIKMWN